MSTRSLRALEWPMAVLALLIVPALVLEDRATDPWLREGAHILNWIVWLAFCAEFVVRRVARRSVKFLREAWFDLLLIVLSRHKRTRAEGVHDKPPAATLRHYLSGKPKTLTPRAG
jgi:hypothetical protein